VHWWGWLSGAAMVVFWGLVIWAIAALVGWSRGSGPTAARRGEDPEQILARRFTAGEIDAQEYHRRLDTLRGAGLASHAGR